jgi:hypothetical protein
MINPASEIRKGLYTLWNGNITYQGNNVPVYEGSGAVTPYQILIQSDSYTSRKTKTSRFGRATVTIEVVTEQETAISKPADDIANSAMELITPEVYGNDLSVNGFQITSLRQNTRPIIREQSGKGTTIVRRIIELNFLINQINV